MSQKRTENFSTVEKATVVGLIEEYAHIVENKATDGKTCREKVEAWTAITAAFNVNTSGVPRTIVQIQNQWRSLKQKTKKEFAAQRQHRIKTGGGAPPPPLDEISKKVFSKFMKQPNLSY